MKKFTSIFIIPMCFILLIGCQKPANKTSTDTEKQSLTTSKENIDNNKSASSNYTIKDYYPFKENTIHEYDGKGNEFAPFSAQADYIKNDKIQLRKDNGGTVTANVIEYKNGELKIVFSKEEAYYREDLTSKPSNKDEILLKEPLVKGTSWTLADGKKRYISNVDVEVSVPAGNFKAIEVTTEGKDFKEFDYYALNTGLIKSMYTATGMEVTSSLKAIKSNSPLVQTVKFYYPNGNDYKTYFVEKQLNFNTNDITKLAFEKYFKESPDKSVGKLIGPNVKIKSLYLNNDTVYVDFTKELISEMNAGSGYEGAIVQGITNTLGDYYKVNKVYITIEDKPYESGHILMKKGETFSVDLKNSSKLNK